MKRIFYANLKDYSEAFMDNRIEGTFIIEQEKLQVFISDDVFSIVTLENALQVGKIVREVKYWSFEKKLPMYDQLLIYLETNKLSFEDFVNNLVFILGLSGINSDNLKSIPVDGGPRNLSKIIKEHKGIAVFSPMAKLKPVSNFSGRWTIQKVMQAFLNGQIVSSYFNYKYTDDYYHDFKSGYHVNVKFDMMDFAWRFVSDRFWKPELYSEDRHTVQVRLNGVQESRTIVISKRIDVKHG